MSVRQPVSVALWDEMRASPRMVAGSVSEGGADPARIGQDFRVVAIPIHKCTRCYGDFARLRFDRRICSPCERDLETLKAKAWRDEYRRGKR